MSKVRRTRLISDAPSTADAFGPHQKIASVLSAMIQTEDGGKAIALEGGWGSGKSTVVNLLRNQTEKDQSLQLVVFDAWAHEGDPLRRSFLETLIGDFSPWLEDEPLRSKWKDKVEHLARRKKDFESTTTPLLTPVGKWMLLSAFLVPVGLALLNAGLQDTLHITSGPGRTFAWRFVFGIVFSLAPVIVLAIDRFLGWKRDEPSEAWAVLAKGTVDKQHSTTIETPDPTSIEFQSTFIELMEDTLGADLSRQAVLVVDNLDRVSPEDALAVWSSLRTFFQLSEHNPPDWFWRFWIIVPYDPGGISRLWSEDTGRLVSSTNLADEEQGTAATNSHATTSSFLSKTFQLRLSVPPLLVSDWRQYLDGLLREALPDHPPEEFHAIYRLYAVMSGVDSSPTPRSLKVYVNDLGGLHRLWQDSFPLADMAYYILLRQRQVDIKNELKAGRIPTEDVADLVSRNARDHLVAQVFGTSVPEARQLLVRDRLTQVLEQADTRALVELESTPGFWEVLESIDFSQWAASEAGKLANAAYCLVTSGIVGGAPSMMKNNAVDRLRAAGLSVKEWRPLAAAGRGIAAFLDLCPDEEFARHLLESTAAVDHDPGPIDAKVWADAVLILLGKLDSLGLERVYHGGITIAGPSLMAIAKCSAIANSDAEMRFWRVFRVEVPNGELTDGIRESIDNDTGVWYLRSGVRFLREMSVPVDWDSVVRAIQSWVENLDGTNSVGVEPLLGIIADLRSDVPHASKVLSNLSRNGILLHHLFFANKNGEGMNAVATCLFLHLQSQPSLTAPPNAGNATAGHRAAMALCENPPSEFIAAAISFLEETNQIELLYTLANEDGVAGRLAAACLSSVDPSRFRAFFPPERVLESWPMLAELQDDEGRDRFVRLLIENTSVVSWLVESNFNTERAGLYVLLVRNGASSELWQWCVNGLQNLGLERWKTALAEQKGLAELVVNLTNGRAFELGYQYKDAVLDHAEEVAAGNEIDRHLSPSQWNRLFDPLPVRDEFRRKLLDIAVAQDGGIGSVFFSHYGKELARQEVLNQRLAISGLFTPLLKLRNTAGLRWILEFLQENPGFLSSHPSAESVEDFRGRLRETQKSKSDEMSDEVRVLLVDLTALAEARPAKAEKSKSRERKKGDR